MPQPRAFHPTPLVRASLAAHGLGAAALLVAPEYWPAVGAALVANHVLIASSAIRPQSRLLGPNLARLPEGLGARVALTFDDGPDPAVTSAVLALLERHHANGTFFCIGRKVDAHRGLVAEIAARGHSVENHTYNHPHTFAFYGSRAIEREVLRAQEAIERATGRAPGLFRAPVGIRNPWLEPCLARAGLSLVSWSRRGFDAVSGNAAAVSRRLLDGLCAGDIVLLHDGNSARGKAGQPVVLEALPRLLEALDERGLTSVSLAASSRR